MQGGLRLDIIDIRSLARNSPVSQESVSAFAREPISKKNFVDYITKQVYSRAVQFGCFGYKESTHSREQKVRRCAPESHARFRPQLLKRAIFLEGMFSQNTLVLL